MYELDDKHDFMETLRNVAKIDAEKGNLAAVRIYNKGAYWNPKSSNSDSNSTSRLLVLYTQSKTESKRNSIQGSVKSYIAQSPTIIPYSHPNTTYTSLTHPSLTKSDYIDCYLPLTKVERVLSELIELDDTPYEIHLIDNSAMLRVYPRDKSSEWLDKVTSKVLRHKGVIYSKKELLDKADPNLITRIIGAE